MDAPEDSAMYIHRVGRTARYKAAGRALLFLMPSEEERVAGELQRAGVPIKKLTVNQKRTVSVASQAAAMLVSQPECRLLAKKAFVGYLRSLQLLPGMPADFDPNTLPIDHFAASLGKLTFPVRQSGSQAVRQSGSQSLFYSFIVRRVGLHTDCACGHAGRGGAAEATRYLFLSASLLFTPTH